MKWNCNLFSLVIATAFVTLNVQAAAPTEEEDATGWKWLACGRGKGGCGDTMDIQVKTTSLHEVRCCSDTPIAGWKKNDNCDNYHESDLTDLNGVANQCFHRKTYAEAEEICKANGAYVCSKEQFEKKCVQGSGCGHDADMVWTSDDAEGRQPPPAQETKDPDDWLWLSCGRGKDGCGVDMKVQSQAKEGHEVRCCSKYPIPGWQKNSGCSVWSESDLIGEDGLKHCFHNVTYKEAQAICLMNHDSYVCSKEEVEKKCSKGTGCGHDADLIWTSDDASAREPVVFPNQKKFEPDEWIWLSCGKGEHECGIGFDVQAKASSTHELRCCSPFPISGWKKNPDPKCDFWHESDLIDMEDGRTKCFHDVTYSEAQEICAFNGGHVCTKDQIDLGCAKGSGCGHDGDLIWTGEPAPARDLSLPSQEVVADDDWLWLTCGRGGNNCGFDGPIQAQAKERHEFRCCSNWPIGGWRRRTNCKVWAESDLMALDGTPNQCFDNATYSEAQAICKANNGYVCTYDDLFQGCGKGTGCGHDADYLWTSKRAPPRPPLDPPVPAPEGSYLFLACGAGQGRCDGIDVGVAKPNEQHEVRCCTPYPLQGWKKGDNCKNYHESDLKDLDGTEGKCFHTSTYAEAQALCAANDAQVCSMDQVLTQCAQGSGCGHDADLIWTRTAATEAAIADYKKRRTQAEAISGVCLGSEARISGDPHFTTYDKLRYDCQGHGEFVIAMAKGSDPLAIHGQFASVRADFGKPSITRSLAIKVSAKVPVIQVTVPKAKINGACPMTFSYGPSETVIPDERIISFGDNYEGAVTAFKNRRNIIFTYPEQGARIQITAGGGGNRCVLNTNLCLTPENHGGADNIVGLLGSPDGNQANDWMNRDGTLTPLPTECSMLESSMTNSEKKQCRSARNREGHNWCMQNWCVGHADNSLWNSTTHEAYNRCYDTSPDPFFDNDFENADPKIIELCEDADDEDACVIDALQALEDGMTLEEFVKTVLDEDEQDKIVAKLDNGEAGGGLDDWDTPPLHTKGVQIKLPDDMVDEDDIELIVPDTPPEGATCPVCRAVGWGDPHMITFDGVQYDVHVKGEMTFLKSLDPASDFTIQARTVPVKNHKKGPAVTAGVVVHETGQPRIQVSLGASELSEKATMFGACPVQLFVDGTARDIMDATQLNGASVKVKGKRIVVEYINTNMRLDMRVRVWRQECHFSVLYHLADCRCDETLVGLLGQPDGKWWNDWHNKTGSPKRIPKKRRERRGKEAYKYSRTWCINAAESKFTYEPNMSHDDFDKCSDEKGGETNYDVDVEKILEDAKKDPNIVEKCTIDEDIDIGCAQDCLILGPDGCDDFVRQTKAVPIVTVTDPPEDIPDTPDAGDENTGGDLSTSTGENSDAGTQHSQKAGSLGDPHFKTWKGEHFEYHGQCDLILARDPNFADGLGLEVQIRTKLVRFWSYIKRAAIRIGDDILEVEGNAEMAAVKTKYWFNFLFAPKVTAIGGFPLTIESNHRNKRTFTIDLSSKFPGQKITISTYREFVRVDFNNGTEQAFGNTVGMLGDFRTGSTLARDGVTEIDDFFEFGNEWQLLPVDDMLFHDKSEPQFPRRCIVPEDPQGQRRRRLGESKITVEQAEAACAKTVGDKLDMKDCVYDVLATQDLDMVGAF